MDEDSKRGWDVRLGIVAPILTVAGILVGVWQFNAGEDHRREEARQAEELRDAIEFRRKIWLTKVDTYQKVVELAGRIVASAGADRSKAYTEFRTAYWGAMVLVEDPAVEQAMIRFDQEYRDLASGWNKDEMRLMRRAEALAKACRASLETRKLESVAAASAP